MPNTIDNPTAATAAHDKVWSALTVLRSVQDMRYAQEHAALREAMRQAALAALDSALTDLREVQQRSF